MLPTYIEQKVFWLRCRSIAVNASCFSLHFNKGLLALCALAGCLYGTSSGKGILSCVPDIVPHYQCRI